jgi:hypothetical protein
LVIGLALAMATRAGNERGSALASGAPFVEEAQFAHVLADDGQSYHGNIKAGQVVIVSDGLESPDIWAARAKAVSSARAQLIVVLIADEAEASFPFEGRTNFRTSASTDPILIGRAEAARADYQVAYRAHFEAVTQAIQDGGGQIFSHTTNQPVVPVLLSLAAALDGGRLRFGAGK